MTPFAPRFARGHNFHYVTARRDDLLYYVITEEEGGGLQIITVQVIVSNTTTVKVIMGGGGGFDNEVCEQSLMLVFFIEFPCTISLFCNGEE